MNRTPCGNVFHVVRLQLRPRRPAGDGFTRLPLSPKVVVSYSGVSKKCSVDDEVAIMRNAIFTHEYKSSRTNPQGSLIYEPTACAIPRLFRH